MYVLILCQKLQFNLSYPTLTLTKWSHLGN